MFVVDVPRPLRVIEYYPRGGCSTVWSKPRLCFTQGRKTTSEVHCKRKDHRSRARAACSANGRKLRTCKCQGELAPGVSKAPCDVRDLYACMEADIKSHMTGENKRTDFKKAMCFRPTPKAEEPSSRRRGQGTNKSQAVGGTKRAL